MAEAGILGPDERVERIQGGIPKFSQQSPRHAAMGNHVRDVIMATASCEGYCLRSQAPFSVGDTFELGSGARLRVDELLPPLPSEP